MDSCYKTSEIIIIIRLYRFNVIDDILYSSQILTALTVFNISLKENFLMTLPVIYFLSKFIFLCLSQLFL